MYKGTKYASSEDQLWTTTLVFKEHPLNLYHQTTWYYPLYMYIHQIKTPIKILSLFKVNQ